MLVSLLILISFVSAWGNAYQGSDYELGGGPEVAVKGAPQEAVREVVLENFKNYPQLVEDPDPDPPLVWSHSAVLLDADSGKVLYRKDERKRMPIASLTKVMTSIVINERIKDWKEEVMVSKDAAFSGGAAIDLRWDEKMTAGDLFKAMLMNSDNAAAIALAEHVAGSQAKFAELMNEKAKELGALDTYFVEPSGLDDEHAYSTAYDLARIAQYALEQKRIRETMQIPGPIQANSCDGMLTHRIGNTNLFLKDERLAPRVIGSKTGFTYKAGYCLMSSMYDAKKKRKVVGVILNSHKDIRWDEMEEMIEWGFKNYNW